jgi:hypothetical protein
MLKVRRKRRKKKTRGSIEFTQKESCADQKRNKNKNMQKDKRNLSISKEPHSHPFFHLFYLCELK